MRKKLYLVASIVLAMSLMTACGTKTETTEATTEAVTEATTEEAEEPTTEEVTTEEAEDASAADAEWAYGEYTYTGEDNIINAIDFYICDELAKGYTDGDVGIPTVIEVSRDDSDSKDIKVWGNFIYETYSLDGDVLMCEAGGSHPGCMHLEETDAGCGYVVTSFDPVADGSDFDSSAKEIFGERYDAFMEVYSNDQLYADKRNETISEYVKSHNVPATKFQDFGWDPVDLKLDEVSSEIQYLGGLYAADGESDINMAFFLSSGELVVIVQEGANYYYGSYTLEDVVLDDGTMYSEITVEGKKFGYQFDDDTAASGIIVDQDGKINKAIKLDESVANDMKDATM